MEDKSIRRIVEVTADGSHTLFVPEMDEHYHSVNGAVQESRHVFIEAGLKESGRRKLRILEIGFGTGLNALLTFTEASDSCRIEYFAVERFPIEPAMINQLNYPALLNGECQTVYTEMHAAPWNEEVKLSDTFVLHKLEGDVNRILLPDGLDLVYFDAFAPDKQPEMWTQKLFNKLYNRMNSGGIITTYCAKGIVRRMMESSGFRMERMPGPPGKREMLRGIKF